MKRIIYVCFILVALFVFIITPAFAAKGVHESHVNGGNGAQKTFFQPGWDRYPDLNMGKIVWNTPDATGKLQLTYILDGAMPNVNVKVGLFDTVTVPWDSDMFSDFGLGHYSGCYTREGNYVCQEAWNIGYIQTDEFGNGSAHFDLYPTPGTYNVQFYILWPGTTNPMYESAGSYGTTVEITIP